MNLHEYQAKTILQKYGIDFAPFGVASNREEADEIVDRLGLQKAVIKVQVHAGGRGKAGGVKFAKGKEEILQIADNLIGLKIVNNQTGKEGVIAHKVLITEPLDIQKEYYAGIIIDREKKVPTLILSPEGGMEIEEIAKDMPDRILTLPLYPNGELKHFQILGIAKFMNWTGDIAKQGMGILKGLCKAFVELDASLLEINPLILTPDEKVVALDAKLSIDENALYRQKEVSDCYDPTQISEYEVKAAEFQLAYIALDGDIGCMVNGAGLAMATMDIISFYGGTPANFLDVGGSADKEKVAQGFKIILSDPKVKAILVNIFGGIMNCATIAGGILAAAGEITNMVPLVVRMEGTDVEEGRRLLQESDLAIISATGLAEAAKLVVQEAK